MKAHRPLHLRPRNKSRRKRRGCRSRRAGRAGARDTRRGAPGRGPGPLRRRRREDQRGSYLQLEVLASPAYGAAGGRWGRAREEKS
jgi:hypothetical protein